MKKPIKTTLYFEAGFPVLGKVLSSSMCPHCEDEGEIRVRTARDPSEPTKYDVNDPSTFVDIVGFDPKGAYLKVKPGDWIEAQIVCFGYLRRVRASQISIEGNLLASGSSKVGRVSVDGQRLTVDFLVFKAMLVAQSEEEMQRIIKREKIRDGIFLETDCSVDIEVRRVRHQASSVSRGISRSLS